MPGTLLFISALFLILGITIYSFFKHGNGNNMINEEVENRLQSFIGTEVEGGIQNQFSELVKTVCTSIQAVNSDYESAVYILHSGNNEFILQKGSSKKYVERIHQDIKLAIKLLSHNESLVFKQNEYSDCFDEFFGENQWSGGECMIGSRIMYKDHPVGFILVYSDHFSKIQSRDQNIIRYNGDFLTLGMSKIDKIESLLTDNYYNSHITNLYKSVDMYSKEEDVYKAVESLCHRFFTYDKLSISFLVSEEKAQLKCVDGVADDIIAGTEFNIRGSLHGRAILRDEGIRTKNWKEDYSEKYRFNEDSDIEYNFSSVLVTPVYIKKQVRGTIGLERMMPKPFDDSDQKLLELLSSTLGYILSWLKEFQKIHNSSIHDGLTGVLNRNAFNERMEEEVNRANRTQQSLAIIMFDLDKFKRINDNYGHPYGDYVIKSTAQILKNSVRNIDVVARYGGEEFIIILVDTDISKCLHVAERMVSNIASFDFDYNDTKVRMTISAGMAEFPMDSDKIEPLIGKADKALYESKRQGGNMVSINKKKPTVTS
jgi:diguanylate cyclase (GGDEF)-like protein